MEVLVPRSRALLCAVGLLAIAATAGCRLDQAAGSSRAVPAVSATAPATGANVVEPTAEPTSTPTPTKTTTKPKPKPILERGDSGTAVRELQARLHKARVYTASVTGFFGPVTQRAVRAIQEMYDFEQTGAVDRATWSKLVKVTGVITRSEMFPAPPARGVLDAQCKVGRVICIDKTARRVRWVVDGTVQFALDARFGSEFTPTREGRFQLEWKDREHVSTLYHTSMPFAMFFSGGQAVHYSPDFAARGYDGASHGCVNTRNWALTERLFDETRIGDSVVVYRS
jgi:peptidoglycan hydrolase-like protein with peptidoglycan-binding domain